MKPQPSPYESINRQIALRAARERRRRERREDRAERARVKRLRCARCGLLEPHVCLPRAA